MLFKSLFLYWKNKEHNNILRHTWRNYFTNSRLWFDLFFTPADNFGNLYMQRLVKNCLRELGIRFLTDEKGNIYSLKHKNKPLLCAHLDTVQHEKDIFQQYFMEWSSFENCFTFKGESCIGADDKVGLYIALEQLRETPDINFLFTTGEESGMTGVKYFVEQEKNVKRLKQNVLYGIVLDRQGGSDILCNDWHYYGSRAFQKALEERGKHYDYKTGRGASCDAIHLKKYISCCNLSVGYRKPHTDHEYVNLDDMENCQDFVHELIVFEKRKFLPHTFKEVKKPAESKTGRIHKCTLCHVEISPDLKGKERRIFYNIVNDGTNGSFHHVCPQCYEKFFEPGLKKIIDEGRLKLAS